jgi:hypothetical protein
MELESAINNYYDKVNNHQIYNDESSFNEMQEAGEDLINEIEKIGNEHYKIIYSINGSKKAFMITLESINKFIDHIYYGINEQEHETGSDVIDEFNMLEIDPNIKVEKIIKGQNSYEGFYFGYYNNTQFDLTRYQIYTKEETTTFRELKYKKNEELKILLKGIYPKYNDIEINIKIGAIRGIDEHCLYWSFKKSNLFDENELNKLKSMLVQGDFPQSKLCKIGEALNTKIILHYVSVNKKTNKSDIYTKTMWNEGDKEIRIALYKNHYFINDVIPIHLFGVHHMDNEKINKHPHFLKLYKQDKTSVKQSIEYNQRPLTIIKAIFEANKFEAHSFLNEFQNKDFESRYKLIDHPLIDDNIEHKDAQIKKYKVNDTIYVADIETTTQGFHKAYTISWIELVRTKDYKNYILGKNYNISGIDCVSKFLDKVKNKSTVYFHNLKYDWQQIFDKAYIKSSVEKDNQIYKVVVNYFKKEITFLDSWKLIPNKLSDFKNMFGLDVSKDVMPYDLYTEKTITEAFIPIEEAINYFNNEEDKNQFKENLEIKEPNGRYSFITLNKKGFKHMYYAKYYCDKDVEVLGKGLIKFRESLLQMCGLDVFNYTTISSYVHDYFIKEGCYKNVIPLSGTFRSFVQQSIVGGKVYTKDNKKWHLKENIQDFDAVALYPTAMNKLLGFPRDYAEIIEDFNKINSYDHYVVQIKIISTNNKQYGIPMIPYLNKQGSRDWVNKCETIIKNNEKTIIDKTIVVDKITLEDLIKYYDLKFEYIKGLYWDRGFNYRIVEIIQNLFDKRNQYKKEGNKIEKIYKLLMNSAYGKTIMKESTQRIVYQHNTEDNPNVLNNYESKNFNFIKGYDEYTIKSLNNKPFVCRKYYLYENKFEHVNYAHIGGLILSMSKRIMNEINYIAHENEIPIYYVDTDSMHIPENKIELLENKFREKYNRELIGKNMGQFHCDFSSNKIKKNIKAVETIILGKKAYFDLLEGEDENGNIIQDQHIRMKGIPTICLEKTAEEEKCTVKDYYLRMYNDEKLCFNIIKGKAKFEYVKCKGVFTKQSFIRNIKF